MSLPPGFVCNGEQQKACWLEKFLYGLKQFLEHGSKNLVVLFWVLAFVDILQIIPFLLPIGDEEPLMYVDDVVLTRDG